MTNTNKIPPSTIEINLEEKDVQSDLLSIVTDMSQIRSEVITTNKLSDKTKDEYLHLAYRLASTVKGLSDSDGETALEKIGSYIRKDSRLAQYDSMQQAYWSKNIPKLEDALDKIVINSLKDGFDTLDHKQHFLQAIKFLSVQDKSFEEKEQAYDTIKPFYGPMVDIAKGSIFKRIVSKFFGYNYTVNSITDGKIVVTGSLEYIDDLVDYCSTLGFSYLEMVADQNKLEKIKDKHQFQIIGNAQKPGSESRKKFVHDLVKYTFPISLPLLGFLPKKFKDSLEDYAFPGNEYYDFGGEKATIASQWVGTILGLGATIYFGVENSVLPAVMSGYMCVESVIRAIYNHYDDEDIIGSLPFKILFSPLEMIVNKRSKNKEQYVTARINLHKDSRVTAIDTTNYFKEFESLATLEMDDDLKKNLEWNESNNSQFGKLYESILRKNASKNAKTATAFFDKKNQYVGIYKDVEMQSYHKGTILCSGADESYIISLIGKTPMNEDTVKSINTIITAEKAEPSQKDDPKLLEEISKAYPSRFIHVAKYAATKKIEDYELMNW